MITPKVACSCVCLYSWFNTTRGIESRFNSMTTRIPSLSDSSRRAEIPSSFPFFHQIGDVGNELRALLTWYGSSVATTICDLLLDSRSSITARARMMMRPRPVS